MDKPFSPAKSKIEVEFHPQHPDICAKEAQKILILEKAPLFQQDKSLICPHLAGICDDEGTQLIAPSVVDVTRERMTFICTSHITFLGYNKKEKKWLQIPAPPVVVGILTNCSGDGFPTLNRISNIPFLRRDGSLYDHPNSYDEITRTYLGPSLHIEPLMAAPNAAAVDEARKQFNNLLSEFEFETELDRAVAMSGLLSPILRSLYPTCPVHCISSPAFGSGKSYFVTLAATLATGKPARVITMGKDSDELDKRIDACLLEGHPVISVDNVNRHINSDRLAQASEQKLIACRVLGKSETRSILNSTCLYLNGCNIVTPADMCRRTLTCRIVPNQPNPYKKEYQNNPLQKILDKRPELIHHALTLGRYIIQNPSKDAKPLGSFEKWSMIIPPICKIIDLPDPTQSITNLSEESQTSDEDISLVTKLYSIFVSKQFSTKTIKLQSETDTELLDMLMSITSSKNHHIDNQKLSHWLISMRDKIVNNLILKRRDTKTDGRTVWSITKCTTQTPQT